MLDVVRARLADGGPPQTFEAFALRQYGRLIADRFLLDYSAKLWGAPASGACRQRLQASD